ncbi:MAG TPA: radical SAM protein [Planctomycetes bacterium]|nr:radical SAM protein [Planctomycetota bacterium]
MTGHGNETRELAPAQELESLDELWFQVGGTLCNLSCNHCFISCHPGNDTFGFLSIETVRKYLRESETLGVREYYFTGGEPFLNRDMMPILEETLAIGPATVLTNGTVFTPASIRRLRDISRASSYSLELRVSIDGYNPQTNDPIRGEGTFKQAIRGVRMLVQAGFLPIITIAQTWPEQDGPGIFDSFVETLKAAGYERPRIKILPTLHLGMEEERTRPYSRSERISVEMMENYDSSQLLCSRGRTVTDRGVAVCPLLIEAPDAHLGETLEEASGAFRLSHGACHTCYVYGAICSNIGGWGVD